MLAPTKSYRYFGFLLLSLMLVTPDARGTYVMVWSHEEIISYKIIGIGN